MFYRSYTIAKSATYPARAIKIKSEFNFNPINFLCHLLNKPAKYLHKTIRESVRLNVSYR